VARSALGHRLMASATVDHRGGPGALELVDLPPDERLSVELEWMGGSTTLSATTLPTPPGAELTRFATISDLHLGATNWGAFRTMRDTSDHPVPFPLRCATAAVAEAVAWGAQCLIIKGDAAEDETLDHYALVGDLVDQFPELPMLLIPGNHDVHNGGRRLPRFVGKRELPYIRRVEHLDLPGVRIIAADNTCPGRGWGSVDRVGPPILERASQGDGAVFLALHQQLQRTRFPRQWPIGVPAPSSLRLIDGLDALSQPTMISSGHTHRNRSWRRGSVVITEVASTKDWPNVWGGYVVHEGGMRQVVRRIVAPEAITWSEYSRGALNGLWAYWSPGRLDDRCVAMTWAD
jgi:hypothetical protein